jgi:cytochrome c nitrite reductase small subunit
MKSLISWFIPPENWKPAVSILLGVLFGLAAYVCYISRAASYLSDDPKTCINCHVMNSQYYDWMHSSHRENATCNDCHVPHDNVIRKYLFKVQDGIRHAAVFTFRNELNSVYIRDAGEKVVQDNCLRCHERVVGMNYLGSILPGFPNHLKKRHCSGCHRETPHSRVNSIAATPNALVGTKLESRTEREEEE